jgi:hypothetical protein
MSYQGWTLFDKVLIVAKKIDYYDQKQRCWVTTEDWQGYIVDPSNKKMKESALRWAETCAAKHDENGKFLGYDKTPGSEFLYDNDGFILKLKDSAGGSSQGGKLSFWNCWVTAPDGKRFMVGIGADLLLELLTQTTFVDGQCQVPLCFARRTDGVGMLHKQMTNYQQALADMQKKADVKSKKTSKHIFGHAYTALQSANAYAGDIWVWYEPIMETYTSGWHGHTYERLAGFRKLAEPKHLYWFPDLVGFEDGKTYKVSDLRINYWNMKEGKLPARIDSGVCVEYDITLEECIEKAWRDDIKSDIHYYQRFKPSTYSPIGWGTSKDNYELPEDLRKAILDAGLKIED